MSSLGYIVSSMPVWDLIPPPSKNKAKQKIFNMMYCCPPTKKISLASALYGLWPENVVPLFLTLKTPL